MIKQFKWCGIKLLNKILFEKWKWQKLRFFEPCKARRDKKSPCIQTKQNFANIVSEYNYLDFCRHFDAHIVKKNIVWEKNCHFWGEMQIMLVLALQ